MKLWLTRLYPRAWRQRYGDEFTALLEQHQLSFWDILDIIQCACEAHVVALRAIITEDSMMCMTSANLRMRIFLMLTIGVILTIRSALRADNIIFGLDLVGLVGVGCLILGLVLSYHRRRQSQSIS